MTVVVHLIYQYVQGCPYLLFVAKNNTVEGFWNNTQYIIIGSLVVVSSIPFHLLGQAKM